MPILNSSKLKVELITESFQFPTSMAFTGHGGDLIVTQKGGKAFLFLNATKEKVSIANFTVNEVNERGLLGVTVMNHSSNSTPTDGAKTYVFFYLTETQKTNRTDVIGNRVYRFEWNEPHKSLSNGTLILDLPVKPGLRHNGGKIIADQEKGHLYAVIGDLNRNGTLQNQKLASPPDDTSVILRVNADGTPASGNPFLNLSRSDDFYFNMSKYYAYGVRNSFGMGLDPVTGKLWITENGPHRFDEINLVEPGFNSGWNVVFGPLAKHGVTEEELLHIPGSHYADPLFSWANPVGVTDIEFLNSTRLGEEHANNIFAGDFKNGHLYNFKVNKSRNGLEFNITGINNDTVASTPRQVSSVIFGTNFGGITDLATGPDGSLYVLSFNGKLYRIVPR